MDSFNIHSECGVIRCASGSRSHGHNAANGPNVSVAANSTASGKVTCIEVQRDILNVFFNYYLVIETLKAPIFKHVTYSKNLNIQVMKKMDKDKTHLKH